MKTIDRDYLIDGWLKYHNTNCKEVIEKYPEEIKTPAWFSLFKVTQEQHDEWVKWAKEYLIKGCKIPKKIVERGWGMVYLDCSPSVISEDKV